MDLGRDGKKLSFLLPYRYDQNSTNYDCQVQRESLVITGQALGHSSVETMQIYDNVVDRIRENPTRYLEELIG